MNINYKNARGLYIKETHSRCDDSWVYNLTYSDNTEMIPTTSVTKPEFGYCWCSFPQTLHPCVRIDVKRQEKKKKDAEYLCTGSYHDHSTCIDHIAGDRQGDGHSALAAVGSVGVSAPCCLHYLSTCQAGSGDCDHSWKEIISTDIVETHS